MRNGFFITFEGGEGSGKTTQINRLAKALTEQGFKVITTREPGGTPEAESIRNLLVQRDAGEWTPMAEVLLLYAARVMHVEKVIQPALNDGKIVICDRFSDSTLAYQGYGHGLALDDIQRIDALTLNGLKPNLTLVLDIASEEGLQRSDQRLAAEQFQVKQREDRYEQLEIEFHQRLRNGFLSIAEQEPERCKVIDASKDMQSVTEQVLDIVISKVNA